MTVTHPELIPIATDTPPTPTNTSTTDCVGSLPRIAPENRCSAYNSGDYSYPQSVEHQIVAQMGGRIYSPYTGTYFVSTKETDIEHIVARSEAHDSGLCSATAATKRSFSIDLLNLTLASPSLNRNQKWAYDLAEWLPSMNQCWYVNRVVEVKKKYDLTMDRAEAQKAQEIWCSCTDFTMQFTTPPSPAPPPPNGCGPHDPHGPDLDCGDFRTHREAQACFIAAGGPDKDPHRLDGNKNGLACESLP